MPCRFKAGADGLCRWHRMNVAKDIRAQRRPGGGDLHRRHDRNPDHLTSATIRLMCDAVVGPKGPCGRIGPAYTFRHMDLGDSLGGVHHLCRDEAGCYARTGFIPSDQDDDE